MRSLNGRRIRSFAIRAPMLQLFSNTAAHLQPACSQHAARLQHDCSMPHDREERGNQSTLSRIKAHSRESYAATTLQLERGNQCTLSRSKHTDTRHRFYLALQWEKERPIYSNRPNWHMTTTTKPPRKQFTKGCGKNTTGAFGSASSESRTHQRVEHAWKYK